MTRIVSGRRSLVKALTYRMLIMCLDFGTIYVLSGTVRIALSFMIASNVYTSAAYFFHERAWARVKWGLLES